VLNPDLLGRVIEFLDPSMTFADIDGQQLLHLNGEKYPFRRLPTRCSYKLAKDKGWISAKMEAQFLTYHISRSLSP
jgi:hypothetical protein